MAKENIQGEAAVAESMQGAVGATPPNVSQAQSAASQKAIAIVKTEIYPATFKASEIKNDDGKAAVKAITLRRKIVQTIIDDYLSSAEVLGDESAQWGMQRSKNTEIALDMLTEDNFAAYGKSLFASVKEHVERLREANKNRGDRLPKGNLLIGEAIDLHILGPTSGKDQNAELRSSF